MHYLVAFWQQVPYTCVIEASKYVRELAEAVTYLVENAYRGMARTFDINRIGLLRLAAAGNPIRPSDAAEALAVSASTVSRYASMLEKEGLVSIVGDSEDGRSCRIGATDRGRDELARFNEAGAAIFAGVIHDWSTDDIQQFTSLISRLAEGWSARGPVSTRPPRAASGPRWRAREAQLTRS